MIAVGTKLTSLAMVESAIAQGFALKTVMYVESDVSDDQIGSRHETEIHIGYLFPRVTTQGVDLLLADREVFACLVSEYDEWMAPHRAFLRRETHGRREPRRRSRR